METQFGGYKKVLRELVRRIGEASGENNERRKDRREIGVLGKGKEVLSEWSILDRYSFPGCGKWRKNNCE